ncbi:MAG: serine/threonine-protein kinase [Kofleriaceae bacterium]
MECLDANVVQDLMAGALDEDGRATAMQHLDGCADCRDLIESLAREASHDAAKDTLQDTEKRAPSIAMMDTVGSDAGLLATEFPDPVAVGQSVTKAVRVRTKTSSIGQELGRYKLVERLGAGAMGIVYRAEDRELGRDVALKQLHRPDAELTDRLVREARSMAQVNHPNVVAVYDVGVLDGVTYIAMELVSGQSMRAWQEVRTVEDLLTAYLAAGRGLAAAHAAGIVHRDFKPDNVLVGKDGRVRVTDFGLAASRPVESGPGTSPVRSLEDINLTTSGSVLGTPAYMAPEQFTGGNVDARTDQFNFCVALYEALFGQRPFPGKTFDELADNVIEGRVRPPPAKSQVSRALRAIVLRGLSVKPGDRYPTMDHLLEDLGRDRARPWRRSSRIATLLAAALALGLASDWVIRGRLLAQIEQSFDATARQTNRAMRLLASRFDAISNQVYSLPVMRDVTGHHDQADFGLGTPEADREDLEEVHAKLVAQDWKYARAIAGKEEPAILAISDYKGRLLYTSAAPDTWGTDLIQLPWIKRAFDAGAGNSMTLQRYDDPRLVATKVLGTEPHAGLAVLFTRTLSVGETARSQFLQIVAAKQLLEDIRLDDETQLSLVALDGTIDGAVSAEVAQSAEGYQVRSITLSNPLVQGGEPIGRLVMARPIDSVLSLFPHARTVFAIAMFAAIVAALAMARRARTITGARAA